MPSFISSTNELINDKEKLEGKKIERRKEEKIKLRMIKQNPGKFIYQTKNNKEIEMVNIYLNQNLI